MRRSKLELYEDILSALANTSLTVDAMAYACNTDCTVLFQHIKFLIINDLVEEKEYAKETRYALTRRGMAIFKTLVLTRTLKKLQVNTKMMNKALQAIPTLSEYNAKKSKRKRIDKNY
jgi:predicted transcriptional regulator